MRRLLTVCFLLFTFIPLYAQFITTWTTTESDSSITITVNPNSGSATVNYNIDWGDTNVNSGVTGSSTHKYDMPGTYAVSITGSFPGIEANIPADNALKLTSIDQWDTIQWKTMRRAFSGAQNMTYIATDTPNLSEVTTLSETFRSCSSFNGDIRGWDVGSITNMYATFRDASSFNQDLSDWKVFNVTGMANMFQNATAFNQSLGDWEIRLVEEMDDMLNGSGLSTPNYDATLIGWEAFGSGQGSLQPGVNLGADQLKYCVGESARGLLLAAPNGWSFSGDNRLCQSEAFITTWSTTQIGEAITIMTNSNYTYNYSVDWENDGVIDITGVSSDITHNYATPDSNHEVAIYGDFPAICLGKDGFNAIKLATIMQWGTIQWQTMDSAFFRAQNMTYHATDLPDLSQVTSMAAMFRGASSLNQPLGNWDTENVTDMSNMFLGAISFNQPLNWNTSNVTDMSGMFSGAIAYNSPLNTIGNNWNTSNVTDMSDMFLRAHAFDQPLNDWNTSNVIDMSRMFYQATSFNYPLNTNSNNWNTSSVTDMSSMFSQATDFNQSLNDWNTGNVTDMSSMFASASSFNGSLNNWNTSNVTIMRSMFSGASTFNQPLNSVNNSWNTANVIDMSFMFSDATAFDGSLNDWNTSNVTDMKFMFNRASAFNQSLDASNDAWNTGNVTDMHFMFSNATSFNHSLETWNTSNVTNMSYMFAGAKTFNQPLNIWNLDSVQTMVAMFSNFEDEDLSVSENVSNFNQPLDQWNVSNVINMRDMFVRCDSFDQNLGSWNFENVEDIGGMLSNCNMSIENYDSTLIGWSTQNVPNDLSLGANGLSYCAGAAARQSLMNAPHNWTFFGDSEACGGSCPPSLINTYIGPAIGVWDVIANWSNSAIPERCDDVLIGAGKEVSLSDNTGCRTLEISAGGSLVIDGFDFSVFGIQEE